MVTNPQLHAVVPGAASGRTVARPARLPGRVRRGWVALLLTAFSTLTGCYSFAPVTTTPAPGATLVLDLNDQGRVALGDSIGPSASRIEGVVAPGSSSDRYLLYVSSVQYLNQQSNRWAGEELSIRPDYVNRAQQREFSRSRSILAGLGVAAAIAAVIIAADLLGSNSIESEPPDTTPGPQAAVRR